MNIQSDEALGPIAVWTGGRLGQPGTKTADGLLLLGQRWKVACVIDSDHVGKDAGMVIGAGPLGVPVVSSPTEAVLQGARSAVIAVNRLSSDTEIPQDVRDFSLECIRVGLNVISGSHAHLVDNPELAVAARRSGVALIDIRTEGKRVNWSADIDQNVKVLLTVGTDSAVGKMTTAILLHREAKRRGIKSAFLATGQIAAMCGADAVTNLDHTLGDFLMGSLQHEVQQLEGQGFELVVVEGQGAILHRAYGVISTLFGAAPDVIVMCHDTDRVERRMFPGLEIPPVKEELFAIEALCSRVGVPASLAGFSVFGDAEFRLGDELGLPTVNIFDENGPSLLMDSVLSKLGMPG